jgi:ribosomal protein S18 acetylase RimI-like enzyme
MTLTGDSQWCKILFEQYYGVYNYYDIDPALMAFIRPMDDNRYTHQVHHLMYLDRNTFKPHPSATESGAESLAVRKAKKMKREVRYHLVEPDGRVLGSVLIEEATAGVLILSEFIVKKPFRGKGLGGYFVNQLIQMLFSQEMYPEHTEILLYVDDTNEPAKKLYKKVGFKTIRMLENLILIEDD